MQVESALTQRLQLLRVYAPRCLVHLEGVVVGLIALDYLHLFGQGRHGLQLVADGVDQVALSLLFVLSASFFFLQLLGVLYLRQGQ